MADLSLRSDMLEWLLPPQLSAPHSLTLAQRTAGYMLGDFVALVNAANRWEGNVFIFYFNLVFMVLKI